MLQHRCKLVIRGDNGKGVELTQGGEADTHLRLQHERDLVMYESIVMRCNVALQGHVHNAVFLAAFP